MNRHWITLEYPAILERLAEHTDFSGGRALALALTPAPDYREARERLALTQEARALLEARPDFALGGVRDVRPLAAQSQRGVVLQPSDLLTVRETMLRSALIHRTLSRLDVQFPGLADIAWRLHALPALTDAISRVLDDRGEVRDNASPELSRIRHDLHVAMDRIQARLRRLITSKEVAPYIQDALITRRDGRFVIPVKSDFKGQVQGIVHDRSSSGVTLFMEPVAIVELNNALRELTLAEEEEIHRLLAALSAQVAYKADEIVATVDALAELDLTLAKARYAYALTASEPELLPVPENLTHPEGDNLHPGTVVYLKAARHPLLDPEKVVPVNLMMEEDTHILVITGPNTGGKTVSLKTLGLLTLMAQAGMHIPVDPGSRLSYFEHIYADIGDEQSIEQSLSTFSSHLTNILSFLEEIDHQALVLLDELGAGTDPAEGAALARAMLESFRLARVTALVATHYPELKLYAHNVPGVKNASMEFDAATLSPTYRLSIGLPGRSNAFAIARRLGMPEEIVKKAQGMLSGEELRAEDMLADLHSLRIQAARARDEAAAARRESQKMTVELRERMAGIERERADILRHAEAQVDEELAALRSEVQTLRRRLLSAPLREASHVLNEVETELEELTVALPESEPLVQSWVGPEPEFSPGPICEGDTVRLLSLGTQGTVATLDEGDAEAVVQVGAMRMRVALTDLELLHRGRPVQVDTAGVNLPARAPSPGLQIDLRGHTVEQALERLDRYLDDATRAALPWVRIVHGKGTGRLRQEIWRFLGEHPLAASYEMAGPKEGGAGATVVQLISS
ncbi:MAG: endonuclease MutS2 [Anaerolineae bacterium]|nr:endonuclease MutS2 [Anaerolineae bacterium]